jgi:hypothetical protein
MTISPGTRLGPYEIVAPLGAGGMGEVYRAKDTRLGRGVAIKVVPHHLSSNPEVRARFEREARTVSSLNHPNICTLHDVGREGDTDYLVMELLEGETLADRLARGPLPLAEVVKIGGEIADALDRAHRAGVMHRDLKPGNVMLTRAGAKLMDFGLARAAGLGGVSDLTSSPTVAGPLTAEGTIIGTFQYMAPEQLEGQPADARADLWALGCVLYEMATGRRAFEGKSQASLITAIMGSQPPPVSQLAPMAPQALDRLVNACLAKDPADRIQSAHDVKLQLAWMAEGTSQTGAQPAGTQAPRKPRTRVTSAALVVLPAVLLVGLAVGYILRGRSSPASSAVADVTYKPVTFEQGFIFAARFAPDGQTIVYSADWDGTPRDVFVTSLGSPDFRPLGFHGADLLGISRSGELAILTGSSVPGGNPYYRTGTLARASLTGGAPRAELDHVLFADFGTDGALAVVRIDGSRETVEFPMGHVVDELPRIAMATYGATGFFAPRVSPSGDAVAYFERRATGALTVKIADRNGKRLASSPVFPDWWCLAWMNAGELWYAATEVGGTQVTVHAMDRSGDQRVVYRAPGALTLHDISPKGEVLASFDHILGRTELADRTAGPVVDRSWREGGDLEGLSAAHTILFNNTGDSGGPKGAVYIWRAGEPEPVRLSDGMGLALSPDEAEALVISAQPPVTISLVPTGAGRPRTLDVGAVESVAWAGWLRNGSIVIELVRPGLKPVVYTVAGEGKLSQMLPDGMTLRGDNLISPDGSRLIADDPSNRLMLCTTASSSCQPLPGTHEGDYVAGWSGDGRAVFVYQKPIVPATVERLDVATGARTPWMTIKPMQSAVAGIARVVAAPDGAIVYSYARTRSELYVISGLK